MAGTEGKGAPVHARGARGGVAVFGVAHGATGPQSPAEGVCGATAHQYQYAHETRHRAI